MTVLEDLHQRHKERVARMGGVPMPPPRPLTSNVDESDAIDALTKEVSELKRKLAVHSEIIGRFVVQETDEKPRFHEIIEAVCEYYDVTKNDVLSSRRTGILVVPRQIICYLGRHLTGMSFPQMGRRLGGRDHTTAMHGANKIGALMQKDALLADDISVLEIKIGAKVMHRRFGSNVEPLA